MSVPGPTSEVSEVDDTFVLALADERLLRLRQIARLRFAFVTVVSVVVAGFKLSLADWVGPFGLLGAYWGASAAVFLATRRSDEFARLSAYAIPALDVAAVYILSTRNIALLEDAGHFADAHAWRFEAASYMMMVLAIAALALNGRVLAITCILSVCASLSILISGTTDVTQWVMVSLVIGSVAVAAGYGNRRSEALVRTVAAGQQRRARLSRYFAPQIAERIEAADEKRLREGERREVTLLFCDLRDFTELSDGMSGEATVALLNEFHTAMISAVFENGGTLDKLMGDGLMAYFGAPVEQDDHAERAIRCALAMETAIRELSVHRNEARIPLRIGVGVHTGTVVLGSIGSTERSDYTVVGDAVNVASRVERLTREREADVLVSEQARAHAPNAFSYTPVEPATVKGKTDPLVCYRPRKRS